MHKRNKLPDHPQKHNYFGLNFKGNKTTKPSRSLNSAFSTFGLVAFLVLWLVTLWFFYPSSSAEENQHIVSFRGKILKPNPAIENKDGLSESSFRGGILKPNLPASETKDGLAECTYEGNCKSLSTCNIFGTCVPFLQSEDYKSPPNYRKNKGTLTVPEESECITRCINDVIWDERYFFTGHADVQQTFTHSNTGTPSGCVVVYRRTSSELPQPSNEEWSRHRLGAIVKRRAVPIPIQEYKEQRWAVLCYDPCDSESDCYVTANPDDRAIAKAKFICSQNRTCVRKNTPSRSNYDLDQEGDEGNVTDLFVLTYANSGYFKGLKELTASLLYWAPHVKVVIYNLGLHHSQIAQAKSWTNVIEVAWRNGIPATFPQHVRDSPKKYAWKPVAIYETLLKYKKVLVFDAGSVIRGPLDPLEKILENTGNFLVWGQDADMMHKAHEGMFSWFNYTKETFIGGPHYSGNTQGFLYPSTYFDKIVVPMRKCALDPICISPPESGLANHRYDQTALSILSYGVDVMAQPHTEYLAAGRKQVNSDPFKPSFKVVWTARQSSNEYSNPNLISTI